MFKFYQKNQCVESRLYYIIYKGIRSVKQYGYPIIEWGCQNLSDLFKFYRKNQCVENSIEILSQNLMRESNALQNTIEISKRITISIRRRRIEWGCQNFSDLFKFYRKIQCVENYIEILSQNLMRENNALQNTIEISNASLYRWGGGGGEGGGGGGVKNFYRKTDAFFHFYRKNQCVSKSN